MRLDYHPRILLVHLPIMKHWKFCAAAPRKSHSNWSSMTSRHRTFGKPSSSLSIQIRQWRCWYWKMAFWWVFGCHILLSCVHKTLCKSDEPFWVLKACGLPTIWVIVFFGCLKTCLHVGELSACFDGYKTKNKKQKPYFPNYSGLDQLPNLCFRTFWFGIDTD